MPGIDLHTNVYDQAQHGKEESEMVNSNILPGEMRNKEQSPDDKIKE